MEMDKLKQWMELAKNMHGGDFWTNIFDQEFTKQFMMSDQQFNSPSDGVNRKTGQEEKLRTYPIIDILEGESEVIVLIELPGVPKENIELGLNGNILTIKGNASPLHPHLKKTYTERFYGDFLRQITLPDTIAPNQLSAKFWNGLLFVGYQRIIEKGEIIPID
ncbi:Hsp20/alpha crystallin family protein [Neobacillus sp. NRS-1170]|uniref:Hsp20/alpha crystallin family protein n=1 Tax=Neobacillus sp. NRS-1170 TaxID=3233898 RepID=UPI003D28B625